MIEKPAMGIMLPGALHTHSGFMQDLIVGILMERDMSLICVGIDALPANY